MSTYSRAIVPPRLPPAAVLYTPASDGRSALAHFTEELKGRGWRVGGLLQEVSHDSDGQRTGIDAIEVDTGRRISLALPGKTTPESCILDRSALAEATGALRRAVSERMDLIVVEKFGEREQAGEGLADEILAAMAEGIATMVSVPAEAVDEWSRFCGGLSVLLPSETKALWRWWGPHRLYRDVILDVDLTPAKRVVVGLNWTLVEGEEGCGLAQTPRRETAGCRPLDNAGELAGRPLGELAGMIHSWDPFEAAIGVAAVNAHYNRYDLQGEDEDGLKGEDGDGLKGEDGDGLLSLPDVDGPVTVVGRFPGLTQRLGEHRIIERHPSGDEYPETAAGWLLAESGRTLITASTLVDHSLPGLLQTRSSGAVTLVGPGTTLSPRLHAYGIDVLAGMVIENPKAAVAAVAEGAAVGVLKRHARRLTLKA